MKVSAWEATKIGLTLTGVGILVYVGYRVVKGVGTFTSQIGTGKNITGAGQAVWGARPKVIFKGIDDLGGLM